LSDLLRLDSANAVSEDLELGVSGVDLRYSPIGGKKLVRDFWKAYKSFRRTTLPTLRGPTLFVFRPDGPPTRYRIKNQQTTIGRGHLGGLVLPHISVSREHARLTWDKDENTFTLTDLGSQNGTICGGQRLDGSTQIEDGDRFQVGSFSLLFHTGKDEAIHDYDDVDTYILKGRSGFLKQVTAVEEDDGAHETFAISTKDLAKLRASVRERGNLSVVALDGSGVWELPEGELVFGGRDGLQVKGAVGVGPSASLGRVQGAVVLTRTSQLTSVEVNGKAYNRKRLEVGDVFKVGKSRFRLE
ncbi:MAG: FHA domain-containing protein, partial [Myxococcota bacterium]|nr:FHA domain-containing protein [Myxococcota bacterium]